MEILTRTELQLRFEEILEKIKQGSLFIHPTDTIYGIGCNALDEKAVETLRIAKHRPDMPLSIWVPSLDWVRDNCEVSEKGESWFKKIPGPYTLLFPIKNKVLAKNVAPGKNLIGIRLPNHWFSKIVEKCGFPIITTSANITGEPFMTRVENLNPEVENKVEFMIYEGEKEARPSKIVNVEKQEIKER